MTGARPRWRSTLQTVVDQERLKLGSHPTADEIVAYHAGEMEPPEASLLQDHLVLCAVCADLLLELDDFVADASPTEEEPPLAPVVPIGPYRARRRGWWAAAASAAAAAVALFFVMPGGAPLPQYDLAFHGNLRDTRGIEASSESEPLIFATGRPMTILLKPKDDSGEVMARAYVRRDDELRPLSASTLVVDEKGVVSLRGVPGTDLHLPRGVHELVLRVERRTAWPLLRRPTQEFRNTIEIVEQEPALQPVNRGATSEEYHQPRIEFSGCETIMDGPVCVLGAERRLTLWVKVDAPEAEIRIDAGLFGGPRGPTKVQRGYRYEIDVGPRSRELVVEVDQADGLSVWVLELASAPEEPAWLDAAREQGHKGALAAAREILETNLPGADPRSRRLAYGLLARIEGRSQQPELAIEYYEKALAAHRDAGDLYEQVDDATSLVWELHVAKRFSEARAVLDDLSVNALGGAVMARYYEAFYRGLIAEETGDLRAAMLWTGRAAREAERAGRTRAQIMGEDTLALQLHATGRAGDGARLQEQLWARIEQEMFCEPVDGGSPLNACDCAKIVNNRGWAQLLSLEAGRAAIDPVPVLEEAQRILLEQADESCRADELPNVRLNLALAKLHAGDVEGAHELEETVARTIRQGREGSEVELWRLEVAARIDLAESRPREALDNYRKLADLAKLASSPEAGWRAAFGRAQALAALEQPDEAITACAHAEGLLDQESLLVPMHAGREKFIAQRERAARFCLELLLAADRVEEALGTARRSAARALGSLRLGASFSDLNEEDRRRWDDAAGLYQAKREKIEALVARIQNGLLGDEEELARGQIEDLRQDLRLRLSEMSTLLGDSSKPAALTPSPAPGTLLLVYHPLPTGWAAFAVDDRGRTAHHRFTELSVDDEGEPSSSLLAPFTEQIERADVVEVIGYGDLRRVDFHTLPLADGILLERAPVVYRLDLPGSPETAAASAPAALVVSSPELLLASGEAQAVQGELESHAWRVQLRSDATLADVRESLPDVDLFHYAGHAEFDDESRGWDSHLSLAGGSSWTVDDILALESAPRWVVLSGCETGKDDRQTAVPTIGLAQAFLVAGSEGVVAATDKVSDNSAAALAKALYRHWDGSTPLSVALRKAQLELEHQGQDQDWRKFRIITR
ncbi:MAG: CHAT domain-containing protein [bacterium]|nr:CHAT domain-containing protein [bacterium]